LPGNTIADAGFLIALLSARDAHHEWSVAKAGEFPPPWKTCEAALCEAFHVTEPQGLIALMQRQKLTIAFNFAEHGDAVLRLVQKYADVPMSFADACLVRMTEILPDPLILSTDTDFRLYRRHSRQIVPCVLPD
jgi:uncharacterized protein